MRHLDQLHGVIDSEDFYQLPAQPSTPEERFKRSLRIRVTRNAYLYHGKDLKTARTHLLFGRRDEVVTIDETDTVWLITTDPVGMQTCCEYQVTWLLG